MDFDAATLPIRGGGPETRLDPAQPTEDTRDMQGYGQYCPIALAAEVFAERWTPIVIRNLHLGCQHFGELLDGAPGMPRSVLSKRLRMLEREGVISGHRQGRATAYQLTDMGHELAEVCLLLGVWGARWREAKPENQDPYLALWTIARLIDPESLPRRRVVVRFDVTDARVYDRFWVVADGTGAEVCTELPGHTEDGVVVTSTGPLIRWYAGDLTISGARVKGLMTVVAPPWLERELERWGRLNPYAGIAPARFDSADVKPGTGLAAAAIGPAQRAATARSKAGHEVGSGVS
jgi:DNA-binding HxlR family transcriptional regulator